jgi:hypothetical protein
MKHEVIIEISQAKTVITVKGFKGKGCKDITKDLEKSLGKKTREVLTHEYNQSASVSSHRTVR